MHAITELEDDEAFNAGSREFIPRKRNAHKARKDMDPTSRRMGTLNVTPPL